MQVREIMTMQVAAVGPDTSAKFAAEVMAARGFAALPVVDGRRAVIGIVAEADVLRGRLPQDPRLHLRREDAGGAVPSPVVRGVMTTAVRSVPATADIADIVQIFLDEGLRSLPVVEDHRLVGIVSRRDVLRTLVRPDDEIAFDVRHLVDAYTGRTNSWTVKVTEGVVHISPSQDARSEGHLVDAPVTDSADEDVAVDAATVQTLTRTVPGVVAVRLDRRRSR
ncbi:MAG: hypothetical protein JWQ03_3189 [Variovorax sp.]|nr:hypothetical protein [Variovorax sp.]